MKYSICPFCFENINLYEVKFRCASPPERCSPENDTILAKFLRVNVKLENKVVKKSPPTTIIETIKSWSRVPREARCHNCNEKTTTRLCPNCHSELPYTMGEYKDLIFSVIGAKEAGKSHYISVLIEKIRNEVGAHFDCSLQPLNDETIKRYREDFYNPVFKKREIIKTTLPARGNPSVRKPLIYTLSFRRKGLFNRKIQDVVTIVFFDTAGEDLEAEDTVRTENKYIFNSSGIILLLDPLQLAKVRAELPQDTPLPEENLETEDLLNRVAKLIRIAHGKKPTQLMSIPVAVAFSKIDALEPLLEGSSLNYPSQHEGYFDLNEFENVNGEMEARIREWSGDSLVKSLEYNFKKYAFFGLTALGCNPHGTQKIDKLRPRRVEEPFLWLLWQHKLITDQAFSSKLLFKLQPLKLPLLRTIIASLAGIAAAFAIFTLLTLWSNIPDNEFTVLDEKPEITLADLIPSPFETAHLVSEQQEYERHQIIRDFIDNWGREPDVEEDLFADLASDSEGPFETPFGQTQETYSNPYSNSYQSVRMMTAAGFGLRSKPNYARQNNVVKTIPIGTLFYPLETSYQNNENWYRIRTSDGKEGWVPDKYSMSLDGNEKGPAYIEVANRKINRVQENSFGTYVELSHFLNRVSHSPEIAEPAIIVELKLLYLIALQTSLNMIPPAQEDKNPYSNWLSQQQANIDNSTGNWLVKRERFEQLYDDYNHLPIAARILQEANIR